MLFAIKRCGISVDFIFGGGLSINVMPSISRSESVIKFPITHSIIRLVVDNIEVSDRKKIILASSDRPSDQFSCLQYYKIFSGSEPGVCRASYQKN